MSRVSSSNSMAQTPGDLVSATPMAVPPIDRRPNGQDVPSRRQEPSDAFLEMSDRLQAKGKTLKHGADLLRSLRSPSAKNKNKPSESKVKLGYALGIESIIAFIMAFQAHNVGRGMMNKRADPQHWDSMWPLINFTRKEMAGDETNNFRPLKAMLLLLQAVCLEEVTKTFAHIDPSSLTASQTLEFIVKTQRRRAEVWPMMREAYASIGSSSMRIDFVPWYNIDDITDSALRILRRWCSDERVDWTPEPMLRECWPIAPAKPGHT
ncbi:hypothetical protein CDD83_10732 [Cordyceps sp. RAO-2017]|nr:hypothetical protein CDD83_10732 [Cordyceps sp. RAO-2017]